MTIQTCWLLILALTFLSASAPASAQSEGGKPHKLQLDGRPPHKFRTSSERLEDYHPELLDIIHSQDIARRKWDFQISSYVPRKDDLGYVRSYEIWQGDKLIYQSSELKRGYYFPLIPRPYSPQTAIPSQPQRTVAMLLGKSANINSRNFQVEDLTGDGSRDFMVAGFSGGQHCCYSYALLASDLKTIKPLVLDTQQSQFFLKDLSGKGNYQLVGTDSTFHSWNCDPASSPQPLVILRIHPEGFKLADDLLKLPAPDAQYMTELVRESTKQLTESQSQHHNGCPEDAFYLNSLIWKNMLDLIYCGNADLAWQYLNMIWDKSVYGWREEGLESGTGNRIKNKVTRDEFLNAFKLKLATSPYFLDLKQMNHWK